jgi:hypothetical protein
VDFGIPKDKIGYRGVFLYNVIVQHSSSGIDKGQTKDYLIAYYYR